MIRARRVARCVAACWVVAAFCWAAPASAATTLTATPRTDLVSGQAVVLHGTGFHPGREVRLCQGDTQWLCQPGGPTGRTTASATGTIDARFAVRRYLATPDGRVDCASGECWIMAVDLDDIGGTIVVATIAFAPDVLAPQPDVRIRNPGNGTVVGDDVYDTFAPGVPTRTRVVEPDETWTYRVEVENEGPTDDLRIRAEPGRPPFTVRYLAGWYDVTAAVTGTGAVLHDVPHGAVRTIKVQVRAAAGAADGAVFATPVVARSLTDGSRVKAIARVVVRG